MISVVICTYNRAILLQEAIQSICEQELDSTEFELIIVDNNSVDNTREVVESFVPSFSLRYVLETSQGLSYARNRGWKEARGEYVGYLDDDALAPSHWLKLAKKIIETERPTVFGGPVREYAKAGKPYWYKDDYMLNVHVHKTGYINNINAVFAGGNMFCRRDILERLGGFHTDFGMKGKSIGYAEEEYLQQVIHEYEPNAKFFGHRDLFILHLIRPEKFEWSWIVRSSFMLGRYGYRRKAMNSQDSEIRQPPFSSAKELIIIVLKMIFTVMSVWFRNRQKFPFFQNYIYERFRAYLYKLGGIYEQWSYYLSGR